LAAPSNQPLEQSLRGVLNGRSAEEVEVVGADATVVVRVVPLTPDEEFAGALVLLRDVTELRRRERELVTKDATIREIHHRVKNNLQTVAALLRLQSRRLSEPAARAALEEAVRRVGTIAIVHDTLSQTFDEAVDFDAVCDRLAAMVAEVATEPSSVRTTRSGTFGLLPAETATSLAMVLTEVLQNAVEHGVSAAEGTISIQVLRAAGRLDITVDDDGAGLPAGFDSDAPGSLGLSIVRTLVESELGGVFSIGSRDNGGTRVTVDIPLH
jgi:two-component sensor histidine kinase